MKGGSSDLEAPPREDDVVSTTSSANEGGASSGVGSNNEGTSAQSKLHELEEERRTLASNEDKAVRMLRVLVFVVLLITTTIVSIGIHRYIVNDQQSDFEHDFEAHAEKVLESFHESVERKLEALDALAVTITSYAVDHGLTFLNVTVPDIAVRTSNTRILADSTVFNIFAIVTDENRAGWEAYVIENRDSFDQDILQ